MAKKQQATRAYLTDTRVDEAKAGKDVIRIWDTERSTAGFHLRISPGGVKSYCVSFQVYMKQKKANRTIGRAGVITADEARERAKDLKDKHDSHEDGLDGWENDEQERLEALAAAETLAAKEKEQERTRTLAAWAKVWEQKHKPALKPTTQASYASLLKHQILPLLGEKLVKGLDERDVRKLHQVTVREGHETSANRAVAVLYTLLNKASEEDEGEGWRTAESRPWKIPGKGLMGKSKKRKRTLSASECAAMEVALVALVATGEVGKGDPEVDKIDDTAGDLIRFLLFSGLRTGEALGLRFEDVDLEQNTMTIEDHKTDGVMGVKVLPLNAQLRILIQRRTPSDKLLAKGAYVFPGRLRTQKPLVGLPKMWARVMKAADLVNDTTNELKRTPSPHDLRRTFYSTVVKLTLSHDIADILTGHSLGTIRDTYSIDPHESPIVIQASQDAADWLLAAMSGQKVKPGVKVSQKAQTGTA